MSGWHDEALRVTTFWRQAGSEAWFKKSDTFDAAFRDGFQASHMAAARRQHDGWADSAQGMLALLLLLDQFPRNCFRGTGHMYATDPLARMFARRAIEAGLDQAIEPELRIFINLPFGHSEDLADQELSVELASRLGPEPHRHARGHRDIIAMFGRFPHRNRILGRATTAEEQAFLDEGGFAG